MISSKTASQQTIESVNKYLPTESPSQKLKNSLRRQDCQSDSVVTSNDDFSLFNEPLFGDESIQDATASSKREAARIPCELTLESAAIAVAFAPKRPKKSDDTHATEDSTVLQAGIPRFVYIFTKPDKESLDISLSPPKSSRKSLFSLFSFRSAASPRSPRRKSQRDRFDEDDEEAYERTLLEL